MGDFDPATLAQYADAVVARLEDEDALVRCEALETLSRLPPATLAQYADAVVAMLEDRDAGVAQEVLAMLGHLDPKMLAKYADAVVARLEDEDGEVRCQALQTLGKLELGGISAVLGYSLKTIFDQMQDPDQRVRQAALEVLSKIATKAFPRFKPIVSTRARLRWLMYGLRLRVQRIALYWYALPYKPSGPGHARDIKTWERMIAT